MSTAMTDALAKDNADATWKNPRGTNATAALTTEMALVVAREMFAVDALAVRTIVTVDRVRDAIADELADLVMASMRFDSAIEDELAKTARITAETRIVEASAAVDATRCIAMASPTLATDAPMAKRPTMIERCADAIDAAVAKPTRRNAANRVDIAIDAEIARKARAVAFRDMARDADVAMRDSEDVRIDVAALDARAICAPSVCRLLAATDADDVERIVVIALVSSAADALIPECVDPTPRVDFAADADEPTPTRPMLRPSDAMVFETALRSTDIARDTTATADDAAVRLAVTPWNELATVDDDADAV